jgi:glycosyltransferase involved in cell wall biosynthesis
MRRLRQSIRRLLAAALRRWARSGAPRSSEGNGGVTILIMHAWGMGGTIRIALDVAAYLAAHHDVEILSLVRRRDEPFFALPPGVVVTAVDDQRPGSAPPAARLLRRLPSVLAHPADRNVAKASTLWTDVCLVRRLRRRGGGLLIGTRPGLSVLALDLARPAVRVVGHEHMHLSAHPPPLRALIRARYPELAAVITLTRADRREFAAALGDGAVPLVRMPNATRDLGGPAPELTGRVVLAAGRLGRQKGFDLLIRAFVRVNAEHPDWELRICGGGPGRAALERLVDDLGLTGTVTFTGPVSALGEAMSEASMFVLSSRFEGFPLVLLEAMSKGLPPVSFDCPTGPGELIDDHRNGILVPAGDVGALARGMIELIEDPVLRRRCGAEATRTAEAYGMDVIGPRWDRFVAGQLASVTSSLLDSPRESPLEPLRFRPEAQNDQDFHATWAAPPRPPSRRSERR